MHDQVGVLFDVDGDALLGAADPAFAVHGAARVDHAVGHVSEVVVGAEDEVNGTGLVDFQDSGGAFTTADGAAGDLADDLAVVEGADHTLTGKASALGVGFKRADQKDQDGNEGGDVLVHGKRGMR